MRTLLTLCYITVLLASLATASSTADRIQALRTRTDLDIDHATGGITASESRLYVGTDTGTIEERSLDGQLLGGYNRFTTSAGVFNFSSTTNRIAGFTQLAANVVNDVFYFCSEDDDAVYRFNTQDNSITRMAGNGTPGLTSTSPMTGTNARIDCGTTAVTSTRNDARSRVYIASGDAANGNFHGILVLQATASSGPDGGILTLLVGSGMAGHADGQGVAAQVQGIYALTFWKDIGVNAEYLIVAGADPVAPVRYVTLLDSTMHSAAITYSAVGISRSGSDAAAMTPSMRGLINMPLKPYAYGTTATRAFTLSWQPNLASFKVEFNPTPLSGKWGAAITPSGRQLFLGTATPGNGTIVRFGVDTVTLSTTHSTTITPPSKTQPLTRTLLPEHTKSKTLVLPPPTTTTTTLAATPAPNNNGPSGPSGPTAPVSSPLTTIPFNVTDLLDSSASATSVGNFVMLAALTTLLLTAL